MSSPSQGDPTSPVADPAPEQLEVIGTGKAGRTGTRTGMSLAHGESDRHASAHRSTEMQREPEILPEIKTQQIKECPPDLNRRERGGD